MFIQSLRARAEMDSVSQLIQAIIDETGYVDEPKAEGTDEAEQRIENIDELINKAVDYEQGRRILLSVAFGGSGTCSRYRRS